MAANDQGIKVLVEPGKVRLKRRDANIISFEEPGQTTDPVRLYMKEMSRIPLLTRKEEIVLAKEIERGEEIVIKALSKTRFVQNGILSLEEKLDKDDENGQKVFFGGVASISFRNASGKASLSAHQAAKPREHFPPYLGAYFPIIASSFFTVSAGQ